MKVIKTVLITAVAFIAALVMASPASAVAAKFHSVSASISNGGALVVWIRRAGARQRKHRLHARRRRHGRLRVHQRRRESPAGRQQGNRER